MASPDSTVLGSVARFMDSIPERFSLLGGPYQPPRVRADGYLRCAMRGWTKVDGYTEAPIPWPAKWGRSPILCGDLIRAVGREAKATVAYHWGVSVITVYKWRKFLGVLEWNEGSSDLLRYARRKAGHRKGSVAKAVFKNSYSLVKAANPRRRSREFVEMMREITCERLKQVGVLDPRRRAWTPEEDRLLGVFSDAEVAVRTRRSRRAVMSRRRRMRHKCPTSSWTHWTPDQIKLLGTKPDHDLSEQLRRPESAIAAKRLKLHVRSALRPTMRSWAPEEEALLGVEPDQRVAKKTGRTVGSVSAHRRQLEIPAPITHLRRWTAEEDRMVCNGSPQQVAKKLNRTVGAVLSRREFLAEMEQRWTAEEDRLLGRAPDEEIARRIGKSRRAVRSRRMALRIRSHTSGLPRRYWSADEDRLVGTMPDQQLARQLGRSKEAIRLRRIHLGIQSP